MTKQDSQTSTRYRRGYVPDLSPALRAKLASWMKPAGGRSVARGLAAHATIMATATLVVAGHYMTGSEIITATLATAAFVVIAREQRVLELLVHDASHRNWWRHKWLDYMVANYVAAYALMSETAAYWLSHVIHHQSYGDATDPCRIRYHRMGLHKIADNRLIARVSAIIRWLPHYNYDYYRQVGSSPKAIARMLLWHSVVYILPLSCFVGIVSALLLWTIFWLTPMFVVLPVLRSIAEAEEHDYWRANTELATTFTNTGLVHHWLVHPWHDAYHVVHHMYPSIPQANHRLVHEALMMEDEAYRSAPQRTFMLERPAA